MRRRPTFTFVLPTRNRPQTFPLALQSALDQTVDDFEVVVSNNGHDDSPREVVERIGDPRVRYVRTPTDMNMVDSWNFAIGHAEGEWINFLSDDDAVLPRLLQRVQDELELYSTEVVVWPSWNYYPRALSARSRENTFTARAFSDAASQTPTAFLIRRLFAFEETSAIPVVQNCFCRRELYDRIQQRLGAVFLAPAPDYTAATAILALTESIVYIDAPLRLTGTSSDTTHHSDESFAAFRASLGADGRGTYAPIPLLSTVNIVPESVCRMRESLPAELNSVPLDLAGYVRHFYTNLLSYERRGFSLTRERMLLDAFISEQSEAFQRKVRKDMLRMRLKFGLHLTLRDMASRLPGLPSIVGRHAGRIVRGDIHGFSDILGAVRFLDRTCASARSAA